MDWVVQLACRPRASIHFGCWVKYQKCEVATFLVDRNLSV